MNLKQIFPVLLFTILFFNANAQIGFVKNRNHIDLKDWSFKKGIIYNAQQPSFSTATWKRVKVPHTYSMDAINDIGYYRGEAWYRTQVQIPASMQGKRIFIRFEAAGQDAQVFINGKHIGSHVGGYSAFCYEITDKVSFNKPNVVAVKVSNAPSFKRIPVNDNLFNSYGGIYRPVQIFSTPQCNISPTYYASSGVFVELKELSGDQAKIEVRAHLSCPEGISAKSVDYKIYDQENHLVQEEQTPITGMEAKQVVSHTFNIQHPVLWNGRKNPYLYRVDLVLTSDGAKEEVSQTFGLRTYQIDAQKGFSLNGEPNRLHGVAMHEDWKQCGPALSHDQIRQDLNLVDEIGATVVRMSHYQHSDLAYQLADEKGILVWAEIPFVNDYSGREEGNAKQQLTELILQNYNHPAIFVWGLWNEVRAFKNPDEPCVTIANDLRKLAHQLDKTRLTTSASDRGIDANMSNTSDVQAWNKYFGWYYGKAQDLATWLDESHQKEPQKAIGLSEYGYGGNVNQQDTAKQEIPFGNYFPEPVETQDHEICWKIIQDRPYMWISVVWNMFDFSVAGWNRGGIPNSNLKGLMTYNRKIKKDAFYFYKANWSNQPVLYIEGRRNNIKHNPIDEVKVYSNLKTPVSLWVNGEKVATRKHPSDIKIISFDKVKLTNGENTIKVQSSDKKYEDEVKWTLTQNQYKK